jgi:hypothetical protein
MALTDAPLAAVPAADAATGSYVDWPAIFAGTVLASAISLLLLTFGSAIGLSLTSAHEGSGISLMGFSIAAALWLVWVQVSGFMAGGYLTGRLRRRNYDATEDESDIRDGAHGLTVWALGVLIGGVIAVSGISSVISTAATVAGSAASGAASAAVGSADELVDSGALSVDRLLRGSAPGAGQQVSAEDQRAEIGRILVSGVARGTLEDADRQYLVETVAARAGIPPEEAEQRVEQVWAQAQQAEATAREAADDARRIGVIAAFITAASLLIGAVGAYFGAVMGGNHRDKQVVIEGWVRAWR